ncbi:MAG: hypothetical protein EOL97_09630 [Spirochaetia bacterium]|nr:hypothetical protein [Spirochaetia bacterium]
MVSTAAQIQDSINNKLFALSQEYNTSVTIKKYSIEDDRYGKIKKILSENDYYVVLKDYQKYAQKYDRAGRFGNSTYIMLCNSNIGLTKDDIVEFNTDEFKVVEIFEYPMGATNVLTRAFIEMI